MPPAPSLNQCSLHPDPNLRVLEPQGPVGCLGSHPQAGGGGGGQASTMLVTAEREPGLVVVSSRCPQGLETDRGRDTRGLLTIP